MLARSGEDRYEKILMKVSYERSLRSVILNEWVVVLDCGEGCRVFVRLRIVDKRVTQ